MLAIALAARHPTRHLALSPAEEAINFSDSRVAIKAVCRTRLKIEAVKQCVAALEILSTLTSIKMHWKGTQVGTIKNETAD